MSDSSDWVLETTDERFEQDVLERSKVIPVVVDFWSERCAPCRVLAPMLEKLVNGLAGKLVLVKANVDEMPEAAQLFRIHGVPAVYGIRDGEVRDYFIGVVPEHQLRTWIEGLLPTEAEQLAAEAAEIAETDPGSAEQRYREALQLDPNLIAGKIGLATLLLTQRRLDECRVLVEELEQRGFLEPAAEKIKAGLELAIQAKEAGDVDKCRAAVSANPEEPTLKLRLAESLAEEARYEEALEISLQLVRDHKQQFGEPARQLMVNIFRLLPDDSELTNRYRRELASALY